MVDIVPVPGHAETLRRTHWRPKLRAGYFSIKDRRYYLYARKRTILVQDTMELRTPLMGMPVSGSITVRIAGENWPNWRVEGRDLVVSLLGLEGSETYWALLEWDSSLWDGHKISAEITPDTQIYVAYDYLQWNSYAAPTGQKFDTYSIYQSIRVGDCELTRHLPSDYVGGSPVVVTDDERLVSDGRTHQLEFRVTEPRRSLEFNMAENLLWNPHFSKGYSGSPSWPAGWYRTDVSGLSRVSGSGYVGQYFVRAYPTGKLVQEVMSSGIPLVVQTWVRGSGVAALEILFKTPASGNPGVDVSGGFLGYDPCLDQYSYRVTGAVDSDWLRLSIVLGEGTEFDPADVEQPDVSDRFDVRLGALSGQAEFGAAAVTEEVRPGQYNSVSPFATVEYETDPSGFFRHHMRETYPFEQEWNADANSVNSNNHAGFVVIGEEGEGNDEGLGIGELTFDDPAEYGSTGYPQGVEPLPTGVRHVFGRRHVPYAKIDGFQKLRQTQIFDNENPQLFDFEVTEPREPRVPVDILIESPASMYRDTSGDPWMVFKPGIRPREYVSAQLVDDWGNPIQGDWVQFVPSGCVTADPTGAYTDRNGCARAWICDDPSRPPGSGVAAFSVVHRDSGFSGTIRVCIS